MPPITDPPLAAVEAPLPVEVPATRAHFSNRTTVVALTLIFGAALVLRLLPLIAFPSIAAPDEVYQTLEQAHRVVFGYGTVPWEFEVGTRSWLAPSVLAGLMWLGSRIGDAPINYLTVIYAALAALSASVCICTFRWGDRAYGALGGAIAAILPAVWPDNIFYGGRALSESIAAPLIVLAVYLARPGYPVTARSRFVLAGALLAFAVTIRLQMTPAAAAILLCLAWDEPRRRLLFIILGFVIVLVLSGTLDAATWGYPFASEWRNLEFNLFYGVADSFGTEPWWYYADGLRQYWHGFVIIIPLLALIATRRVPALLTAAAAVLLAHSMIAHKEMRFIYPATLMLTVAAGLGLARIAAWTRSRLSPGQCATLFIAFAVASSVSLGATPPYRVLLRGGHDLIEADLFVAHLPSLCGVGTVGWNAAQTYIHHDVPIFLTTSQREISKYRSGFNVLVFGAHITPPPGYSVLRCFGTVCVAERAGSCANLKTPPLPRPLAVSVRE